MKIYYDGFVYSYQSRGGINRYFEELISRLPQEVCSELSLPSGAGRKGGEENGIRLRYVNEYRFKPGRIWKRLEWMYHRYCIARWAPDIIHPTYYKVLVPGVIEGCRAKLVVTVYDFIHKLFPEFAGQHNHEEQQEALIKRADALICISENTRQDLLNAHPECEGRTVVVPLAADAVFSPNGPKLAMGGAPTFVFVGGRAGYKNFISVLQALRLCRVGDDAPFLCLVGAPLTNAERMLMSEFGVSDRVKYLGFLDDETLAMWYRGSVALVYPSLYEGFGIPPLEAMQCGTGVIASNRASLPEVVGDGGMLVDCADPEAIASAMYVLICDQEVRQSLVAKGRCQARKFSWDHTAAATFALYRDLLDKG